jgi:PhnB protein
MLVVHDLKTATTFYQKAFGFAKRGLLNGPGGKPLHAELTLRDTTLMLAPEDPERGFQSAKTAGSSPTSLYLLTENVDKVVARAVSLGATAQGEVADMFWGDRCGTVVPFFPLRPAIRMASWAMASRSSITRMSSPGSIVKSATLSKEW